MQEFEKVVNDNGIYGLPAMAVRGKVVFPGVYTTIEVGRLKSLTAINVSLKTNKLIFLVAQKEIKVENPTVSDLYEVGTVCKVGNLSKIGQENFRVTVEGLFRARITAVADEKEFLCFNLEKLEEDFSTDAETEAYFRTVKDIFKDTVSNDS